MSHENHFTYSDSVSLALRKGCAPDAHHDKPEHDYKPETTDTESDTLWEESNQAASEKPGIN